MNLKELTLSNFRCFSNLTIDLDPLLTVIVGTNGTGKSSILEAAAISLSAFTSTISSINYNIKATDAYRKYYEYDDTIDVQPQYPIVISANASIHDEEYTWTRKKLSEKGITTKSEAKALVELATQYKERLKSGDPTLCLPVIAYYGTGRLWMDYNNKKDDLKIENTRINGYIECFSGAANNKYMNNWFRSKTIQQMQKLQKMMDVSKSFPEFEAAKKALVLCFETLTSYTNVSVQYNLDMNQIEFDYVNLLGQPIRMPIHQLSDGYKSILSLVADIAYRMAVLNPQLADKVTDQTEGIVLIDEIDLHLHPAWQQRILDVLHTIFPLVQFVITTHAPAVIHSVQNHNLRILNNNEILYVSEQTYGKDANSILNQIMLVTNRPPEITDMFTQVDEAINESNFNLAESLLAELEKVIAPDDPDIVSARTKIRLRKLRGKKS